MPTRNSRKELPTSAGAVVGIILIVSFAYGLLTGTPFLWLFGTVSILLTAYVLFLFYRLVLAVEEIAHKL